MLIVIGMPIFLLELVLGQYTGLGPAEVFKRIAPIFTGLGYCCLVVIYLITVYYMVIIAWTVFYFLASFDSKLGWGSCRHDFNTVGCFSASEEANCDDNETFFNFTCMPVHDICVQNNFMGNANRTYCVNAEGEAVRLTDVIERTLSSGEYFNDFILGRGDATWENFGILRWQNLLCLLFSWIVGYLCVIKGIKTSGKAVYFTTIFPYVVLTALVIRSVTLEGAIDGILLYLTPQWEMLLSVEVWGNAASQTFYSFGIACGSLITLASYNNFNNNCMKDTIIVTFANAFTSVYAGFAIFSMLGFLAKKMDVPVEDVATDGPGLAFVAYPEALLRLPLSQLWSVIFFLMLFILGIGCQFAGIEAINTTILDKWPKLRNYQIYVTGSICFSCFVLGIPMCFSGGIYLFTLLEWNTASWAILLIGLMEIISVSWVYGCKKFLKHMKEMTMPSRGFIHWFWWTTWVIIAPAACIGIFIFQMAIFSSASYEDYKFPLWADGIGWMIGISTLIPMPVFAVYALFKESYKGKDWFRPLPSWKSQCGKSESLQTLPVDEDQSLQKI